MIFASKGPPSGGEGGPLELSSSAADIQPNTPSQGPAQDKKRGGRASRDKGNRFERAVVRLLQDAGLGAERVPALRAVPIQAI